MKKTDRWLIIAGLLLLCLAGCPQEVDDDKSIGTITIRNIPPSIPVNGNEAVKQQTYKVYLNASNSMSEHDPPEAKGLVLITPDMLDKATNTYTVTMQLLQPNPASKKDPNLPTGPWQGTASYFSVMISPQSVATHEERAVWIKGGYTFNKEKANWNWTATNIINFRTSTLPGMAEKATALYTQIILEDSAIAK